ncbi:MAG: prephenate dehydrogenase/arogenate dehydrogenase family protein [Proteobacteria bacterium]|jgi:cyclohexadieny/prephenate dehydrogenase|nr:prephenate dehydrogenase/arogenate dehydrogenase family protein [Pseudomonadota bacterium]MDA0996334.1 prephenate dehydrogenase/arogenate dehydrogenase family protein [Pseudomonadota bacterium]
MFKKVSIIGFGLIGSSIAREIRKYKLSKIISACDISKSAQKEVKSLRLANEITSDVKTSVKNADLVFICSPLSTYKQIFLAINKSANKDAIITDVGSSKLNVVQLAEKILSKNLCFVPGHPIAGTEESGPKSGFLKLFKNRWFIITPSKLTKKKQKIKIEKIWKKFGSKVTSMSAQSHDNIMAITSHIPHLIAYNIVGTASRLEEKIKSEVIKFSASGFRDFTRIASSDPTMWRDIVISNKKQILFMLKKFNKDLKNLEMAIRNENKNKLFTIFKNTRNIRKKIIQTGQDTKVPNFGRKN